MQSKTFSLLLLASLLTVMPVVYYGLIPVGMFLVYAAVVAWNAVGTDQPVAWLFVLIGAAGASVAWFVARWCSSWIDRTFGARKRVAQFTALAFVSLFGALPIYGAAGHGRPEFTNAYIVYAKSFRGSAL